MPNNTSNQDNNIITWMDINPWRGLLTYEDPYKTEGRTFSFTGREQAKGSVFAMIDNNLFVTLYGKTGIGKSSLKCGCMSHVKKQRICSSCNTT